MMSIVKNRKICILIFTSTIYLGACKIIKDKTPDDATATSSGFGWASRLNNLTTYLLTGYSSQVRPICDDVETVQVTVDMAIRQLIQMNEKDQTVEFNFWMRLGWYDCQLVWDPEDWNGTKSIVLPIDIIWKPDITLYSSISEEFYGFDDFRAHIYYDGHVAYNFPTKVEALCPIKVTKFPFDSQVCSFTFGSWTYHGKQVNVSSKINTADLSSMKENVEWIIDKAPAVRNELYYGCCPDPYPDVTFHIHLTRKPDYYVTNIIVPSIIVTLVAALGYLLPADSGEKVGLELTVMLAMSVFQLLIADFLPPSADETPWIGKFFTFTLILSGGAACWQVFVLNLHHRGDRPMPAWLKFYVLKPIGAITFVALPRVKVHTQIKSPKKQDKIIARIFHNLDINRRAREAETGSNLSSPEVEKEEETTDSELWVLLALMMDRIGFVVFVFSLSVGCAYIFTGINSVMMSAV